MPEAHRDAQIDVWFFASERNTNLSFSKKNPFTKTFHEYTLGLSLHLQPNHPFLLVHVERSGEPSSMVPVHRRSVGGRGSHQKKNALRWDIVEYLERAESFGFVHGLKVTPSSHQERSRSTSKEISNKDPKYHLP